MTHPNRTVPEHPLFSRRQAIQGGAIGILGLGMNHVDALRCEAAGGREAPARSVIYIFLSGGLAQHDSFDLKPHAPDDVRGEFQPIATATPGIHICEHLPMLASRSRHWALVRSLTHPYNEHSEGHMVMLSGRTPLPSGFNPTRPMPSDHPSIAALAGQLIEPRNNLPPAIVLPEKLIHRTGRVLPGQFGGQLGPGRDPFFLTASRYNTSSYGAWPEYGFHHARGAENPDGFQFQAPNLSLPEGFSKTRLARRVDLLQRVEDERGRLHRLAETEPFDRYHQKAISLLTDPKVRHVFDVENTEPKVLDRYGRNTFGWSLLLARRLVEAGVQLVQVNLGNNETWDTHGNAFPHLKNYLLPPMDRSVSALIDDLHDRGLLESTLIVMAGEFGRTPKISRLPQHYALPGRDHWGAVQTVFLAGGGVRGGNVIGASDRIGAYPASDPQTPENFAATIYQAIGIPRHGVWRDPVGRPMPLYHGDPIAGLM